MAPIKLREQHIEKLNLKISCQIQIYNIRAQRACEYKVIYSPGCTGGRRGLSRGHRVYTRVRLETVARALDF